MKKALKIAAPFILIAAAFVIYASGVGTHYKFDDAKDHWAWDLIQKWSGYGIIGGANGKFRPDDAVTLAEFCTLTARVVPMEETAENTFTDLSSDAWYATDVLKCVKAGIIAQTDGELHAMDTVSRENVISMFARAIGIEPAEGTELLSAFHDMNRVTAENAPYVEAMLRAGIIQGRGPGQLNPGMDFTRAEMVSMMDNAELLGYISVGDSK